MSLAVDLLSRRASGTGHTADEKQEASKRLWALLLYLLRPPFCDKVLARVLRACCGKLLPCLPQIPNTIIGILESYSNSYFYISGT
jgi:Peroxisomal membrane protein (Pex16)